MFHKAKGDEVRSRIVAREFADGVFAPEKPRKHATHVGTEVGDQQKVVEGRTRQLASHDVSVAFFHALLERSVWVKPPKDLRLSDDWLWYVVKALYGMRESSKAFQEVVREMYTAADSAMPCLLRRPDSSAGWHGDDFYTEGEPGALDEVDEMTLSRRGPGASTEGTILRRTLRWSPEGVHMAPDAELRKIWQVSWRSRVRNRVRHQVPEPLVVDSAMCWSC